MKKDYIWNSIGSFLQNLVSPILLLVVTRVNGIEDSGIFSFSFSIAVVFWVIAMWGGRTYQVSDIHETFAKKSYILTRYVLAVGVSVAAYLFCLANGYDTVKTLILMSLVVVKVTESIADSYYGVMQSHNKLYVSGVIMVVKYVTATTAFIVVDMMTTSLLLSCLSFLAVMVMALAFIDIPFSVKIDRNMKGAFSNRSFYESKKIMRILAPVLLVMLMLSLSINIPRYFLDTYHQYDIGYFGILAMPVTLIVLLVSFILQPNVVNLSELFVSNKIKDFNRYVMTIGKYTISISILVLVITALIGVPLLNLIFDVQFNDYYWPMVIIVAAGGLNAIVGVLSSILVIVRVLKGQVVLLGITIVLLAVSSGLIIPGSGILGAMILFFVLSAVQCCGLYLIYKKVINEKIS